MATGKVFGTLDRTPPPFFRQGPSAFTKVLVCAALAVFLMVADSRFAIVQPLRSGLATALLPVQTALRVPVDLFAGGSGYLQGLQQAREAEAQMRQRMGEQAVRAQQTEALAAENARLRELLGLAPRVPVDSQAAEVLFEARDVYSLKLVLDRGSAQGVQPGAPVIDARGVLGQVTRLYPLSAEVTLLADKDGAIPLLNTRTGQRVTAFGGVRGPEGPTMELRFLPANADVKVGDGLVTHGLDGVYPPGLPVAEVATVERRVEGGFARVLLKLAAGTDGLRHLLVLAPYGAAAAQPAAAAASAAASAPAPASSGARAARSGDGRREP